MKQAILDSLKRYPLAISCGAVLLALAVAIVLRGGVAEELLIQESEFRSQIRLIDENAKNAQGIDQHVAALQAIVEDAQERLFVRSERAINTDFFYSFEDRVDVRITEVSQRANEDPFYTSKGPKELKHHGSIVYSIAAEGSFEAMLRFLNEFHSVEAFVRVVEFEIEDGGGKKTSADQLTARLRVVALSETT